MIVRYEPLLGYLLIRGLSSDIKRYAEDDLEGFEFSKNIRFDSSNPFVVQLHGTAWQESFLSEFSASKTRLR